MTSTHNYLVISALGPYSPELISELIGACTQCGCNILNTKQGLFGQEFCIILYLSGNWSAIAKMEATVPTLEHRLKLNFVIRRTSEYSLSSNVSQINASNTNINTNHSNTTGANSPYLGSKTMSYNIQISAIDKEGLLSGLTDFFYRLAIPIEEVSANTFISHTGTRIANLNLRINVSDKINLANLREQFGTYCDDNNLDAFLEPIRNF